MADAENENAHRSGHGKFVSSLTRGVAEGAVGAAVGAGIGAAAGGLIKESTAEEIKVHALRNLRRIKAEYANRLLKDSSDTLGEGKLLQRSIERLEKGIEQIKAESGRSVAVKGFAANGGIALGVVLLGHGLYTGAKNAGHTTSPAQRLSVQVADVPAGKDVAVAVNGKDAPARG